MNMNILTKIAQLEIQVITQIPLDNLIYSLEAKHTVASSKTREGLLFSSAQN